MTKCTLTVELKTSEAGAVSDCCSTILGRRIIAREIYRTANGLFIKLLGSLNNGRESRAFGPKHFTAFSYFRFVVDSHSYRCKCKNFSTERETRKRIKNNLSLGVFYNKLKIAPTTIVTYLENSLGYVRLL